MPKEEAAELIAEIIFPRESTSDISYAPSDSHKLQGHFSFHCLFSRRNVPQKIISPHLTEVSLSENCL